MRTRCTCVPCSSTHCTTKFPNLLTASLSRTSGSSNSSTKTDVSWAGKCSMIRWRILHPYLLHPARSTPPSRISSSTKWHCAGGSAWRQTCTTWFACGAAVGESQASLTWPFRPAASRTAPWASALSRASWRKRLPFAEDAKRQRARAVTRRSTASLESGLQSSSKCRSSSNWSSGSSSTAPNPRLVSSSSRSGATSASTHLASSDAAAVSAA
mmetsp:Transcript_3201/g.10372  ORF Transcript_3201/g.10372 Transcript_3201/m.10372 type:complete len:213 (+) Transcript_3201:383-1021(+)